MEAAIWVLFYLLILQLIRVSASWNSIALNFFIDHRRVYQGAHSNETFKLDGAYRTQ